MRVLEDKELALFEIWHDSPRALPSTCSAIVSASRGCPLPELRSSAQYDWEVVADKVFEAHKLAIAMGVPPTREAGVHVTSSEAVERKGARTRMTSLSPWLLVAIVLKASSRLCRRRIRDYARPQADRLHQRILCLT